ncbi:MAG: phosphoribosylamine--glycine ligase [Clostridia bacterium]|nr:phosphoribosylamine--glycine ligase [Clostridia bacterium]
MDVLLIGSRGREHAIALQLKKDPRVNNIFCIPGNGGLAGIATCIKMSVTEFEGIVDFLDANPNIGLTIISPDESLAGGLADILNERGHRAFGPSAEPAKLESDKSYARSLCKKYGIPSPDFKIFNDYNKAKRYASKHPMPLVVKTNGRTAGKGVFFCRNQREAENALYDVMIAELFGSAGKVVDIEEYLDGRNVVVMAITDGETVLSLPAVKVYKRVFDKDLGMSTAGMGGYVPAEGYTDEIADRVKNEIILPTVRALKEEGHPYKGVLSCSLLMTEEGPKVVDYVVRFCDVESQILIPMIETPLLDVFNAVIDGTLKDVELKLLSSSAVCVVITSGGYPLEYEKGVKINVGDTDDTVQVYHAGTRLTDGELRTSGGRVMGIVSIGETKAECADNVYKNVTKISFDGMHYRKDIARD